MTTQTEQELLAKLKEKEEELNEFTASSKEYETELENSIATLEQEKDALGRKVQEMNETLMDARKDHAKETESLAQQLHVSHNQLEKFRKENVEMEQKIEELEASLRRKAEEMKQIEEENAALIERVSFVEGELEEQKKQSARNSESSQVPLQLVQDLLSSADDIHSRLKRCRHLIH